MKESQEGAQPTNAANDSQAPATLTMGVGSDGKVRMRSLPDAERLHSMRQSAAVCWSGSRRGVRFIKTREELSA